MNTESVDPMVVEDRVLRLVAAVSLGAEVPDMSTLPYGPRVVGYAANVVKDMRETKGGNVEALMAACNRSADSAEKHTGAFRDFLQERWGSWFHFDVRKTRVELLRHMAMVKSGFETNPGRA